MMALKRALTLGRNELGSLAPLLFSRLPPRSDTRARLPCFITPGARYPKTLLVGYCAPFLYCCGNVKGSGSWISFRRACLRFLFPSPHKRNHRAAETQSRLLWVYCEGMSYFRLVQVGGTEPKIPKAQKYSASPGTSPEDGGGKSKEKLSWRKKYAYCTAPESLFESITIEAKICLKYSCQQRLAGPSTDGTAVSVVNLLHECHFLLPIGGADTTLGQHSNMYRK